MSTKKETGPFADRGVREAWQGGGNRGKDRHPVARATLQRRAKKLRGRPPFKNQTEDRDMSEHFCVVQNYGSNAGTVVAVFDDYMSAVRHRGITDYTVIKYSAEPGDVLTRAFCGGRWNYGK